MEPQVGRQSTGSRYLDEMNAILAPVQKHLAAVEKKPLGKEGLRELFCQEWQEKHGEVNR